MKSDNSSSHSISHIESIEKGASPCQKIPLGPIKGQVLFHTGIPAPEITIMYKDERIITDDNGVFQVRAHCFEDLHSCIAYYNEISIPFSIRYDDHAILLLCPIYFNLSGMIIEEESQKPVAGIGIAFFTNGNDNRTMTDSGGYFIVNGINPGSVAISIHGDDYYYRSSPNSLYVLTHMQSIIIKVRKARSVTLKLIDEYGNSVEGQTIWYYDNFASLDGSLQGHSIKTDKSGLAIFKVVHGKTLHISFSRRGYKDVEKEIEIDEDYIEIQLMKKENELGCIKGRVLNSDGKPFCFPFSILYGNDDLDHILCENRPDSDGDIGFFKIEGISNGEYKLIFYSQGYRTKCFQSFATHSNFTKYGLEIVAEKEDLYTVKGMIKDDSGVLLSRVSVIFEQQLDWGGNQLHLSKIQRRSSTCFGEFTLRIEKGNYRIRLEREDCSPIIESIGIFADVEFNKTMKRINNDIPPFASIMVIDDESGKILNNIHVASRWLYNKNNDIGGGEIVFATDKTFANGLLVLDISPPGWHEISFQKEGYIARRIVIKVPIENLTIGLKKTHK